MAEKNMDIISVLATQEIQQMKRTERRADVVIALCRTIFPKTLEQKSDIIKSDKRSKEEMSKI